MKNKLRMCDYMDYNHSKEGIPPNVLPHSHADVLSNLIRVAIESRYFNLHQ